MDCTSLFYYKEKRNSFLWVLLRHLFELPRPLVRDCVIIHFSSADCADDADYSFLLYPIGYNLSASSASSADEELNGGIFDTAPASGAHCSAVCGWMVGVSFEQPVTFPLSLFRLCSFSSPSVYRGSTRRGREFESKEYLKEGEGVRILSPPPMNLNN